MAILIKTYRVIFPLILILFAFFPFEKIFQNEVQIKTFKKYFVVTLAILYYLIVIFIDR